MSISPGRPPRKAVPLPALPEPLIGRDAEVDQLALLLESPHGRLLTLTGPPGVGKTSLAVAAAHAAAAAFPSVAVFVDLTGVGNPALVPAEIAASLGIGESRADGLAAALGNARLLLVLDNAEHVLPAAPAIASLLADCPGLHVLVTSRERLHLRLEREVPVLPLGLPGRAEVADLERLVATPAVAMLVARIRAFQPGFAVTTENRAALTEICVRLDGLPLALELAAPRLRMFSPGELTFRLRHRLGSLTSDASDVPDRHRTLGAALQWSHDLLTREERVMFHRLSVFAGGWTLASAGVVCDVPDPEATTASLVDKSLVRRSTRPGEVARFGMLQSLREFAADQLERDGDGATVRAAHAGYFAGLAAGIEVGVGTAREREVIEDVGLELPNVQVALDHSLSTGRGGAALELASALGWHAWTRGRLGSGSAAVDAALTAATDQGTTGGAGPEEDALAGALVIGGALALARGNLCLAERRLLRGLDIARRVGSPNRTAVGTAFLGHLARARGRHDEAVAQHELAGRLHAELPNAPGVAWSRYDLGLLARRRGDADGAAGHLRAALDVFRGLRYEWAVGCCAWALATVELARGRSTDAADLLLEAMAVFDTADDGRGVAQCLEAVAAFACAYSSSAAAARLLGAAGTLRERLAAPLPDEDRGAYEGVVQQLRSALGEEAAGRLVRDGAAWSSAAALGAARDVLGRPLPTPRVDGALTPREHEVARLVRRGCTNRQIGRTLGISEKTAEVHVHHIIRKLGAGSRAEIAAWVAAEGLAP